MIAPRSRELHILEWDSKKQEQGNEANEKILVAADMEETRLRREIELLKEELVELKLEQEMRQIQIDRLAELAQPVERDTTYLFLDKYSSNYVDSTTGATSAGKRESTKVKDAVSVDVAKNGHAHIKLIRTGDVMMYEKVIEDEFTKINNFASEVKVVVREAENIISRQKSMLNVDNSNIAIIRDKAENLIAEVDKLDHEGYLAVSELLKLRLKIMVAQRQEIEELEKLHSDQLLFSLRESQTKEQLITEMQLMKKRLKIELATSTSDFKHQLESLHTRINLIKSKEEKAKIESDAAQGKTEKYRQALKLVKDRYESLKRRYALEMEGYSNEMRQLNLRFNKMKKELK